jgi:phosphoglycolate phosphatase-like HAD superfamily hydrolase
MTPRPVGFDLDMTLIDSRPQVLASFRALAEETGVAIDIDAVAGRLGLKLEDELGNWFPPSDVSAAAAIYRRHYLVLAAHSTAMPGAQGALAAARSAGAPSAIITAKHPISVEPCLAAAGLKADDVFAFVHGPEKAAVIRRIGAAAYVGDTPDDMAAAVNGGAVGIGVATGSFTESELRDAGAFTTLETLEDFPRCYESLPR